MHKLLESWSNWQPNQPPYILNDDASVLSRERSKRAIDVSHTSWQELINEPGFGIMNTNLQLGLIPQPFCGDIRAANVYFLMLNPGYGVHDYYAELEVPAYRNAALKNLSQQFADAPYPYYFLDPQFAWSGGYQWWHGKLHRSIQSYALQKNLSYANARKDFSAAIASIELIPYHSTNFRDADHWVRDLPSARYVRSFVNDHVLPKVYADEATVIVTRQVKEWNLPDHPNIIKYSATESRSAHLTPESKGGEAVLKRLLK